MLENAIYSILSPEGYASILWKDGTKAKEAAEIMKLTAKDLYEFGVIDKVIKEPKGGAQKNIEKTAKDMQKEILMSIDLLSKMDKQELVELRYKKFRNMGQYIAI